MLNLLNKGKDIALSRTIKIVINKVIAKYGNIIKLQLDSQEKEMNLEVFLKGEEDILQVKINKYYIKNENHKNFLILKEVKTSREWLNLLIEDYLSSQKFEIPSEYTKIVKAII